MAGGWSQLCGSPPGCSGGHARLEPVVAVAGWPDCGNERPAAAWSCSPLKSSAGGCNDRLSAGWQPGGPVLHFCAELAAALVQHVPVQALQVWALVRQAPAVCAAPMLKDNAGAHRVITAFAQAADYLHVSSIARQPASAWHLCVCARPTMQHRACHSACPAPTNCLPAMTSPPGSSRRWDRA